MTVKVPPYSLESERALVALCAIYGDVAEIAQVEGIVRAEHFHDPRHGTLWTAMQAIHASGKSVDQFTLRDELTRSKSLATAGGDDYVLGLWDMAPLRRPEQHARTVREYADRRAMIATLAELIAEGYDDASKSRTWMDSVGARISALAADATQVDVSDAKTSLHRFWQRSIQIQEAGGLLGVRSGIASLDKVIVGFWCDQLTTLGGRPSAGKSALLETCAVNALFDGKRVLYVSVEMAEISMWPRLLAKHCRIDSMAIQTQTLTDYGIADVRRSMGWFMEKPFRLVTKSGITIGELRSIIRREHNKHGCDIVFVDYMQRIRPTAKHDRRDLEIGEVSNGLADLARELSIPIVAGAQVNRQVANRTDRKPMVSDLRESGSIENDSDTVILIHREAQYQNREHEEHGAKKKATQPKPEQPDPVDLGAAQLIIGKNRNGDVGLVNTRYKAEWCYFGDDA